MSRLENRDRPALWIGGATLTYDALARLGDMLIDRSAADAGVVAIVGGRTIATYAAIYACLSRGVAYVPVNPRWPIARIHRILAAAAPDAVLVDAGDAARDTAAAMVAAGGAAIWRIADDGTSERLVHARAVAMRPYDASGLAYVMFTSGSTGEPKGVPIPSAAVDHYAAAISDLVRFDATDRFIQSVELTFDLSVHDMTLCWGAGAMLCVVPEGAAPLGPRFVRQLEATHWLSVPSVAAQGKNLKLLRAGALPSLRTGFFCGEALAAPLAASCREAAPNARLFNIYGPTEATIAFSAFDYTDHALTDPIVPLGWPIGGQHMRIDPVTDEIMLAGPQLSPGYLADPARTAAAFVEQDGRRWYRTGDRGYVDPAQGFIYRGRLDAQIKLRGYRVELGDVEAALRRHSGSDLVAAIPVREIGPSSFDGIVGVIGGAPDGADLADIRSAMRQDLPDYMLPERLIAMETMPKNASDKVDHRALRRMIADG
ncbi:AMP-binding protein [Sphingomonas sp. TZW2008]|uniref:AMP-binding protein n=1 Tax=Sphingomonas sp. TZW2008 TaxID=1917973 RepID=UPI000A2704CD|nr:AMP-binding protein [Sphingomonas sp. TZW2008]